MIFFVLFGMFDVASDWYYYSIDENFAYVENENRKDGKIIRNMMLFFLIIQFVIQCLSWCFILGLIESKYPDNPEYCLKNSMREMKRYNN